MKIDTRADAQAFLDDLMKFAQVSNQLAKFVMSCFPSGAPADATVRDYVTDDQAQACIAKACEDLGLSLETRREISDLSPSERRERVNKACEVLGAPAGMAQAFYTMVSAGPFSDDPRMMEPPAGTA